MGNHEISFLDVFSASVTRPKVFQNSVQKYFQSLLVIYFQTKKKHKDTFLNQQIVCGRSS